MNPISFKNNFLVGPKHKSNGVKLEINPLTLSFRDDQAGLEKLFLSDYFATNLKHLKFCHFMAIFYYGLTGISEIVLFPESYTSLWVVRYAVVIPIFCIGLIISYTAHYAKYWQIMGATYILATGGGFIMMIIMGPQPGIYAYYVGIIICLFFGYTFIRERFIHASAIGCFLLIFYLITSIYIVKIPTKILLHHTMYLIITNFLGMMICYFMEYSARRDFYLVNIYQEEREKVNVANRELERRVKDRTNELSQTNKDLRQEISERQRADTALRESEEKYRLLVDNADTAIFIAQDQVIKFPNPRTLELTGYSAQELATNSFSNIIFPEDRALVFKRHRQRLAGEDLPNSYEFRIQNKNGQELWTHLNTALISWEGSPATLNFLRDITAQKHLETKLHQAQKMEAIGTLAGGGGP